MGIVNKLFILIFLSLPLFAEESRVKIQYFSYSDFSRNSFYITIYIPGEEERSEYIDLQYQEIGYNVTIDSVPTHLINGSMSSDSKSPEKISFQIRGSLPVEEGDRIISIYDKHSGTLLDRVVYKMPPRLTHAEEQPLITKIQPAGGVVGDTITFRGKNFGNDIDNVLVQFISTEQDQNFEYKDKYLAQSRPYYLSRAKDEAGEQEFKFTIPTTIFQNEAANPKGLEKLLGKKILVKVYISGRPSTMYSITLLPQRWKFFTGILSAVITILFIMFLSLVIKRINFLPFVLYDKETNMYSLSNFQAFLWTLTFIGSYFYVAVSTGLLLKNGDMPDFPSSLIALLGISYGGLISANYVDSKSTGRARKKGDPSFKDLFCSAGGFFNLPKFQLFGFTLISNAIYLLNLYQGNVLEGLPDIPQSLHTLLLTSQGGYVGGKYVHEIVEKKDTVKKEETAEEIKEEKTGDTEIEAVAAPVTHKKGTKKKNA